MAVPVYHLQSVPRRILIDGVMTDTYQAKYVGVHTDGQPSVAIQNSFMKLKAAWNGRENPKYVVFGDYYAGAPVYTDWPRPRAFAGENSEVVKIEVLHEKPSNATWVGVLKGHDDVFELDRWFKIERDCETPIEGQLMRKQIEGLIPGSKLRFELKSEGGMTGLKLVVWYQDSKDGMIIKMVVS